MSVRLVALAASAAFGLSLLPVVVGGSASAVPATPTTAAATSRTITLGTTTGALPACPSDYWPGPSADFSGIDSGVLPDFVAIPGEQLSALSKADCLWQNDHPPENYNWFRTMAPSFSPDEIQASTTPQVTTLRVEPVEWKSITSFADWGCLPRTSFPGGCSSAWRSAVLWREANAAGYFDGLWKTGTNNPFFAIDYTRCGGGPKTDTPSKLPCQVSVRFAKDATGKVLLQKNVQVVVEIAVNGTCFRFALEECAAEVPVSFVIRAGGGLAITAASTPRSVRYGGSALVTARVDGVVKGSAVVAESGPTSGRGPWRVVGTAVTDAKGLVRFTVKPTATTRYRVRLVSAPVGVTVSDDAGIVSVVSTVAVVAGRVAAGKVPLTITVRPGVVRATVQRLVGKRWGAVASVIVPKAGVGRVSVSLPKGRSTLRVVVPARTGLLGTVSGTVSVVRP